MDLGIDPRGDFHRQSGNETSNATGSIPQYTYNSPPDSCSSWLDGIATIFAALDRYSADCVGLHVANRGNRFEALEPIRQGMREHFGGLPAGLAAVCSYAMMTAASN